MYIDIRKIKIKDRIRKDFGDISELADDIKQNGLINPPVINKEYELLAGERRLRACKQLGWEQIPVSMMDTRDAEHDLEIEISENEVRKDFSKSERIDYARRLERIESAKAEKRMMAGVSNPSQISDEGRTDEIVAQKMGIGSRDTYHKEKVIVDNRNLLDPKDFAEWDEGKLSTNKAYQKIKAELAEKNKQIATLENREPTIKEVIKEVVPADYEKAKEDARIAKADFKHMQQAYEAMAEKWKSESLKNEQLRQKEQDPEIQYQKKVKIDAMGLCAGVSNFLEKYGGCTYFMGDLNKLTPMERSGVISAVQAMSRWADEMMNITVSEVVENE